MPGTPLATHLPVPHIIRGTFAYNEASGKKIGTLPSGAMVTGCKLRVDGAFNGAAPAPTVNIGWAGSTAAIAADGTIAPAAAGSKTGVLFPKLAADQDIIVTHTAGGGATAGLLEVIVEFYPHSS